MAETRYWIWFQGIFGIGTRRSHLLMEHFSDPQELYDEIAAGGKAARMLTDEERGNCRPAMEQADRIMEKTLRKTCRVLTPDDLEYPALLHNVFAKPAALYVKGNLTCLENRLVIAMVGARKCSEYGAAAAEHLAGELALREVVLISGLARGIDSCVHKAALAAGGKTVGILGCGLDINYPAGSEKIKRAMCENGAVITEFPMGTPVWAQHFPLRNRLISGMAQGVVVVEAGEKSGALITAQHALEQGRDVFAVPGSIFEKNYLGVHQWLRDGVKPVRCAQDILDEYPGFDKRPVRAHTTTNAATVAVATVATVDQSKPEASPPRLNTADLPEDLSQDARAVCILLDGRVLSVEELSVQSGMEMGLLQAALTELEIYGIIISLPGRQYVLCAGAPV